MSKIINLRKSINTFLLTKCEKVFYQMADDEAGFPYVIFTIEEIRTQDYVTMCELELNCCDYGRNTAALETICDNIRKMFDYFYYENDDIAFTCYFNRKNNVASDDPNVIRRRMVFDLNLYDKE